MPDEPQAVLQEDQTQAPPHPGHEGQEARLLQLYKN
jgi:hypothetical protein